jgi:small subunit ribosomal protein S9|tara:strand:+ start:990 stop:1406 length:417 start_codon:yes stop_codon:yes gene_type:complete
MLKSKKTKQLIMSGSRKTAKATVFVRPGIGRIRFNKIPVEIIPNVIARERLMTPIIIAGELRNKVDVDIQASGGGVMGQADASAIALSKALITYFKSKELKNNIMAVDEYLVKGDPRQSEPKKFGGPGARARKQKSYR